MTDSLAPGLTKNSLMVAILLIGMHSFSDNKTEVAEDFPSHFPETLTARGEPIVYTRANSTNFEYIGMPVGGIGAGQLYLGGDGKLWFWDIFNLNFEMGQLKGEEAYQNPYRRSHPNEHGARMVGHGFTLRTRQGEHIEERTLDRDGVGSIKFVGQYPIGTVRYTDAALPVEVELEAFSPFIPGDLAHSSLPATILHFTVQNISQHPVEVDLSGWMENAVLIASRQHLDASDYQLRNRIVMLPGKGRRVEFDVTSDQAPDADIERLPDFGTLSLSLLGDNDLEAVHAHPQAGTNHLTASTGARLSLASGEKKHMTFLLTWHFPNTQIQVPGFIRHEYASRFPDAFAVADYITEHMDELAGKTRLWRETWYDSTLPHWFLDRTFLNISILASSTVALDQDGRMHGWEGGYQGHGTCNHVWGYAQAMDRLFPELERRWLEKTAFVPQARGGALREDGVIAFRTWTDGLAVDGQAGIILRAYLAHQMSADDAFLRNNYASIKHIMQGLTNLRDPDHDGILTGPQHNTLDAEWYGRITWLSLLYQAALRAASVMADEMDDPAYAVFCRQIADAGRAYIEEHLFNGEYFIHEGDPAHPDSPGVYTGCEYSQLFGQSWAYGVGLGEILDPAKTRTALESLWTCNFTTDVGPFREKFKPGRWYAMPGEGGFIACTWPHGGSEVLKNGDPRFAAYNNESQNGYEYALSSLMMWHGMPDQALTHMWYMHNNRYHGSKRNPWCEVEWGLHYARSMASYGLFTAASGYAYHGVQGHMAFAPKFSEEHFKAAFVAARGWGSFEQQIVPERQTCRITLCHGTLSLNTVKLELPENRRLNRSEIRVAGTPAKHHFRQNGQHATLQFENTARIRAGESIDVTLEILTATGTL